MHKRLLLFVAVAIVAGCATPNQKDGGDGVGDAIATPQLWSDHKQLSLPVEACAAKARQALDSLGFTGVVKNGNYSYGNLKGDRAAVKCVEIPGGSLVYFAVAGPQKESVENLRNEIAWKL